MQSPALIYQRVRTEVGRRQPPARCVDELRFLVQAQATEAWEQNGRNTSEQIHDWTQRGSIVFYPMFCY